MTKDKIIITDELVEINGKKYVPENQQQKSPNYSGQIKIVVLQRGWIYIGRFTKKNNWCKLENAYGIQTWGTTKGLCELVDGPTSKTILNKCNGIVEFHELTIINTIEVNESKWTQI